MQCCPAPADAPGHPHSLLALTRQMPARPRPLANPVPEEGAHGVLRRFRHQAPLPPPGRVRRVGALLGSGASTSGSGTASGPNDADDRLPVVSASPVPLEGQSLTF